MDKLLFADDFSQGMTNWWVEGGEKVWVENHSLHMKADPAEGQPGHVCTAWCREWFPGNIKVTFDAHVIQSGIDANNINFFLCYSDPSGKPLNETRADRREADYASYHQLNGYIFTYLNDFHGEAETYADGSRKARIRIRRCPGFNLLSEKYDYHCRQDITYGIEVIKKDNRLTIDVDGAASLNARDAHPLSGGYMGFRTFRTYLKWSNVTVSVCA